MSETENIYALRRIKVNVNSDLGIKIKDIPVYYDGQAVLNPFPIIFEPIEKSGTMKGMFVEAVMDEIATLSCPSKEIFETGEIALYIELGGLTSD